MNRCRLGSVVFVALVGGLLGACTPPAERPDVVPQIETDEFSPTITIDGPAMIENPLIGIRKTYGLMTYIDKRTYAVTYVIEAAIVNDLGGVIDVRSASDDTATRLPVAPVIRNRGGNATVDVIVAEAVLRARAATGYRVELIASDGTSAIVTISPRMISQQLAAVDQYLQGVQRTPPPARGL